MRCPDCMKFVAYGEPEIDGDASVEGTTVTAMAEVALTCGDCGTTLKTASIEGAEELETETCEPESARMKEGGADHAWTVADSSFDAADRTEGKGRGMRTFYGFTATIKLSCEHEGCEAAKEIEITADEQASSFEEAC